MNLSELITRVRSNLNEDQEGFFINEDIISWLNQAQFDIAKKTKHLQEYKYVENANGKELDLPDDFIKEYKVIVDSTLIYKEGYGVEKEYNTWNDEFRFSFELDDSKVEIFYYRSPDQMSVDTDTPEVPVEYEELLVNYALYKARMKDRRPEEATVYYNHYIEGTKEMKKEYGPKARTHSFKVERQ